MTLSDYIESIREKSIAVIGIGVSNLPLIRLLAEAGCRVTACDRRSLEQLGETGTELAEKNVSLRLGEDYLENLHEDIIFRTPGIMPFEPHLAKAAKEGSILTSEMEVFFRLCPCRIFAVTGSDGKTTTTTIISEMLKQEGYTVHVGGNIGNPLLPEVASMRADDLVVLELSSFQLHSMACHPHVAVITNISPNHLDKHLDYQDYIDAKMSIFREQTASDRLVLFADDAQTPYYASKAKSSISFFTDHPDVLQQKQIRDIPCHSATVCRNGEIMRSSWSNAALPAPALDSGSFESILPASDVKIPGEHNVRNYLAAIEAVRGYVSAETCRKVAMSFCGVHHRLETIR
ncbi:MAG: UDP-N-acetylmuramoyl-L-alanine--D-glutamate ligase, partial [Oscillospiraceae bacterium]|nr:UDP-N-acetylmuramoyl-L-alanine--D-glutamate ligase [Oscillospiraceae bacterium]